jgi:hypothetical protein
VAREWGCWTWDEEVLIEMEGVLGRVVEEDGAGELFAEPGGASEAIEREDEEAIGAGCGGERGEDGLEMEEDEGWVGVCLLLKEGESIWVGVVERGSLWDGRPEGVILMVGEEMPS